MNDRKKNALRWSLMATVALGVFGAGTALAQDNTQQQEEQQRQEAEEEVAEDTIVVTGSRIRRDEFTSSSPIQVITSEAATLEGLLDTAEILQESSLASGSGQINNQFTGFVTEGGPGVNTISLRGLGAGRTLVLLNGRRLSGAGTRGQVGAVDLNTIPDSIIQRIEILKDGASSIYGSDAVAGVVNIITNPSLDQGIVAGGANIPLAGGGEIYSLNSAWGIDFDRGNFTISGEIDRLEQLAVGERDWARCQEDYVFSPTTGDRLDLIDPQTNQFKCFGLFADSFEVLSGPNSALGGRHIPVQFLAANTGPTLVPGFGFIPNGPTQALANDRVRRTPNDLEFGSDILNAAQRWSIYSTFDYQLLDNVEVYAQGLFSRRESEGRNLRQYFPQVDPGRGGNTFGGIARPIATVTSNSEQSVDFFQVVGGFRGNIPGLNTWDYDAYVSYSRSIGKYENDAIYNDRTLFVTTGCAVNSAIIAGVRVCPTGGTVIPSFPTGTVPTVNFFEPQFLLGNNFSSQAARDFLFFRDAGETTYEQLVFSASASGELFQLPAGPVAVAGGVEYRDISLDDIPGLQQRTGNLWGQSAAGRTTGSDSVWEAFGEIDVPLLANLPLIESLTFNGSYRMFDYESFGNDSVYKIGLNWQILPEFRLRSTLGTSYRTPALSELFLANQTSFLGQANIDPCIRWQDSTNATTQARCAALGIPGDYAAAGASSATIFAGGGIGLLEEETSEALSIGAIWQPGFADLSVAVDYFEISIDNQIAQFGAGNILGQCYSNPRLPADNQFCNLFVRNGATAANGQPPFAIVRVTNNFLNLNEQFQRGLDLTIRHVLDVDFGRFTTDIQATWTFEDQIELLVGTPIDLNGDIGDPDFTANSQVRFDRGDWTFTWSADWIGKASSSEVFGGDIFAYRGTPGGARYKQHTEFVAYHTLSARYEASNWSITGGVGNIFDEPPPSVSTGASTRFAGNAPLTSQYYVRGRSVFLSLAREF